MSNSRCSNLQDWLQWQESLHGQEIDLGLERIRIVYEKLAIAWGKTKFITVGGTNGKGSTIAFLNAIYLNAGYRVGQFTSPHFLHYNERIRVNSQPADDQSLCDAFALIDQARGNVSLTYFEFSTLAALLVFAQNQVDVVLMEVGLGGRLDASNLVDADCSIVTSVSIDHRDWLGDTREQIGREKAGIFRSNRPAICGDLDIPESVRTYAQDIGAAWYGRGQQFDMTVSDEGWSLQWEEGYIDGLPNPKLLAPVQLNNAACAVLAVQLLSSELPVNKEGLAESIRVAQVPGRMQVLSGCEGKPDVVLDVAHNEDAARSVVDAMRRHYGEGDIHLVLGMLADKEVSATVSELAKLSPKGYLAAPASPRALAAGELREYVVQSGWPEISEYGNVAEAYRAALLAAESGSGVVLVVGSFFTVAEVMGLSPQAGV